MAFDIRPQEFNEEPLRFKIKTNVPKDKITDVMIERRVRNAALSAGDHFLVQCMTHGYDAVLHEAEFVVVGRSEALATKEVSDVDIRQIMEVTYIIARKGEWWASPAAAGKVTAEMLEAGARAANPPLAFVEHKGGGTWVVKDAIGEEVRAFTKEQGGKPAAEAFARGEKDAA